MTIELKQNQPWRPIASRDTLQQRAAIMAHIRDFFRQRKVLEVETPVLSRATVTDPYLQCFETQLVEPGVDESSTLFMQTSPEFHMKRLLASGSGCIFQICKSFRNEESGSLHNPEFTMLEWYRLDYDHFALMDELELLIKLLLNLDHCRRMTYQQAFVEVLCLDPLTCTLIELQQSVKCLGLSKTLLDEYGRDDLLQLAFSQFIEPQISSDEACFVYDFPASQASLARISSTDPRVAERFELYYKGVELANGFHELSDVNEQSRRFRLDCEKRVASASVPRESDPMLLAALESGLPDCAGVALGLDRVIMLALDKTHISEVIAFPQSNC